MKQTEIAFGILAGGGSTRMGRDKAQLPAGGGSFLEAVLAAGAPFPERLVSVSADAEPDYAAALQSCGVTLVRDEKRGVGPLEGVRQLLRHMTRGACLITATDMPFLTAPFLESFAGHYAGEGNLILTFQGRVEPLCGIYCAACLPVVEELLREGLRRPALLYPRVPTRYLSLEETGFTGREILNINTKEEYNRYFSAKG